MRSTPIRFAVVGLGHIAQVAVLPAFAHAKSNARLAALVSDDAVKRRVLGKSYGTPHTYAYREYDACLRSGEIDAVYIALPNSLHRDFALRAARAGIHILCEKPLAVTAADCRAMARAADRHGVKLMVAYRLHFETCNLRTIALAQSGQLGDLRLFHSVFTQQVRPGDIRLKHQLGGGPLYDIGIYCINAARYLFRDEPIEVSAFLGKGDRRFQTVEESASVLMRFPQDRLATFSCSFGATDETMYEIIGTKGRLRVEPAYEYVGGLNAAITIEGTTKRQTFQAGDQFAPQLIHFASCIRQNREPEPNGLEGLIDVQIIEALHRSALQRQPITLRLPTKRIRPDIRLAMHYPPVPKPKEVHTKSPTL
ncbi:MAG: oxidoreductase [Nitrospira sp.]